MALRRETRELELSQSRIKQIFLEFQNAVELLNDKLSKIEVVYYDFKNEIDLDKYQKLLERGSIERANAFSITFTDWSTGQQRSERFMFRYCRPGGFLPKKVIPLELNHLDREENKYIRLSESSYNKRVRLRYLYLDADGKLKKRTLNILNGSERDSIVDSASDVVQEFIDDVMKNVIGMS